MNRLRLFAITTFLMLACAGSALGQAAYNWSISSSSTDPGANTGSIAGFGTVYLWLECTFGGPSGASAAEFDVEARGGVNFVAFTPSGPGILNAGGVTNLLLALGGCPSGPVLVGSFIVTGSGPGALCFVPSQANGLKVTVDCAPNPNVWDINWVGLNLDGFGDCRKGTRCSGPISVEEATWGSLKGLYR